jgi:hypothetical protein
VSPARRALTAVPVRPCSRRGQSRLTTTTRHRRRLARPLSRASVRARVPVTLVPPPRPVSARQVGRARLRSLRVRSRVRATATHRPGRPVRVLVVGRALRRRLREPLHPRPAPARTTRFGRARPRNRLARNRPRAVVTRRPGRRRAASRARAGIPLLRLRQITVRPVKRVQVAGRVRRRSRRAASRARVVTLVPRLRPVVVRVVGRVRPRSRLALNRPRVVVTRRPVCRRVASRVRGGIPVLRLRQVTARPVGRPQVVGRVLP